MSDALEEKEAQLKDYGLTRVTEGEHLDAWNAFWGVELMLQEQAVWKQWVDALKPQKRNAALIDAAMAVGVLSNSDDTSFPPCTFLSTPWKASLPRTDGRIMVTDDYKRLEAETVECSRRKGCRDVAIAGQSGFGRTYLSHFILAHALARQQNIVFFTGNHVVIFCPLGVFRGDELNLDFVTYSRFEKVIEDRPWALVDVTRTRDYFGPVEAMFFSIRVYPPSSRHYELWMGNKSLERLVLDALPAPLVVVAATLQLHIKATRTCLQQLLSCLRIAGLNLRSSLSLNPSSLRAGLRDYVASLNSEALIGFAKWARLSAHAVRIARTGDGPDIFLLRRDITPYEACLPTIASRHIIGEIAAQRGFAGLSTLRDMEVVRRSPDGFLDTKIWLFEHLCHAMLSSGLPENLPRLSLSQCFPTGASKRKGDLKITHLCAARSMDFCDMRSNHTFDTDPYRITETLVDGTVHALLHSRPDNAPSGPVGYASSSEVTTEQRRKLRPRVRVAEVLHDRHSKRRRVPADRRFVIFLQVVFRSAPQLTDDGLQRLQDIMNADADAEYYHVHITPKDATLDLSAVSPQWLRRLKWYHLSASTGIDDNHLIGHTP